MHRKAGIVRLAAFVALVSGVIAEEEQCSFKPAVQDVATNTRIPGRIIDVTLGLAPDTVNFASSKGVGNIRRRISKQEDGDLANESQINGLSMHTATHVDAPGHFVLESYKSGKGVESLDLYKLNGPVYVVEVPHDTNITAEALEDIHIPAGTERIIFKTLNTHRRLLSKTPFHYDYTAVTKDGAQWLLDNTDIKLVGVDYCSVAIYEDLRGAHITLLPNDVVVVEALVLDEVAPGPYTMHCLPLKIVGSDGAPARCILVT